MTSLLGKLTRLFPESVPLEDLFTEAVARLFERRPELCLAWLEEAGLLPSAHGGEAVEGHVRVASQRSFAPLDQHDTASRPDLLIEVYRPLGGNPEEGDPVADVVMAESKIGSGEGQDQLRRYAEHLYAIAGYGSKTLVYITRVYDPKDPTIILGGLGDNVRFEQLRWHDFYHFMQKSAEKDALVEEVMAFMEEQGMARTYRFSTADLATLSGIPRAFEIMEETLGGKVKATLESFAGNRSRHETVADMLRNNVRYIIRAPLRGADFSCYLGYRLRSPDGYPFAHVTLHVQLGAAKRNILIAAMKWVALREGWEGLNLEKPKTWVMVRRKLSLAGMLQEEGHVAALQAFFVESIRQLKEELTAFKKDHPDLPWGGGK